MLIDAATLEAIRDGRVTTAFRRWKRPTVKTGGTLLTALGRLEIREVEEIDPATVSDEDARAAGFDSADALRERLSRRPEGVAYRIVFGELGPDPRASLRESATLGNDELAEVTRRLARMDARSTHGPWTEQTLRLIAEHPAVLAADLAAKVGRARDPFKADVRKLKALGLTVSLERGYRLSPRGTTILAHLTDDASA